MVFAIGRRAAGATCSRTDGDSETNVWNWKSWTVTCSRRPRRPDRIVDGLVVPGRAGYAGAAVGVGDVLQGRLVLADALERHALEQPARRLVGSCAAALAPFAASTAAGAIADVTSSPARQRRLQGIFAWNPSWWSALTPRAPETANVSSGPPQGRRAASESYNRRRGVSGRKNGWTWPTIHHPRSVAELEALRERVASQESELDASRRESQISASRRVCSRA